jgi:hypothetical protein
MMHRFIVRIVCGVVVGALYSLQSLQAGPKILVADENIFTSEVQALLTGGLDVARVSKSEAECCLHGAVQCGDASLCRALLALSNSSVNSFNEVAMTPLMIASQGWKLAPNGLRCGHDSPEIVALLLAADAEPNSANCVGRNALMCAAQYDLEKIVFVLLRAGADPFRCDAQGNNVFMIAQAAGAHKVVDLLERGHAGRLVLHEDYSEQLFKD